MTVGSLPTLKLIGRPALRIPEGERINIPKKAFAVALFLILDTPKMVIDRDSLAQFLWPQLDLTQQFSNLRTLLKRIRIAQSLAGASAFEFDARTVRLTGDAVDCDLVLVKRAVKTGDAKEISGAVALMVGDLLESCGSGPASFEQWLRGHRLAFNNCFTTAACRVLAERALEYDPAKEQALALKLMSVDPTEEEPYRAMLRIYGARKDFQGIRQTYDQLAETLRVEIGCEPTSDTKALLRRLIEASTSSTPAVAEPGLTAAPVAPAAPPSRPNSPPLLLLPSQPNLAEGTPSNCFSTFTDDLVARLWMKHFIRIVVQDDDIIGGASVVSALGSQAYRVSLGMRQAECMRVSVRLTYIQTGDVLWAESIPLTMENFDHVINRISDAIIARLEEHAIDLAAATPESEHPNFALIAQGNRALLTADLPSVRRARRLFRTVLQADDKQIQAYAGAARSYWLEWLLRAGPDQALLATAEDISRKAVALQPNSYLAHREVGMIALYQRRHDLALEHLSRAREIHPHDSELVFDFADALIANGQAKEAIELAAVTSDVDFKLATFGNWAVASGFYITDQYQRAISQLSMMQNQEAGFRLRAACHAMLGQVEQAQEYRERALESNPDFSAHRWISIFPFSKNIDKMHLFDGFKAAGFA